MSSARDLANLAGRDGVTDLDVLEGFVLHGRSAAARLLSKLGLESELLLSGCFDEDGNLNTERFSVEAEAILQDMLKYAQHTRLVGSSQVLAALITMEHGLARRKLRLEEAEVDIFLQALLDQAIVFNDRPKPKAVSLSTCSTRVRRILNLAELLARVDDALVGEEHVLRAYMRCVRPVK
jgi:hypothetical protein